MRKLPLVVLALAATVVLAAHSASAGTIYLSRAAFLGALVSPLDVTEDFEGFATGPASNPLTIMGGLGEILDTNPFVVAGVPNLVGGPSPSRVWRANVGSAANPATIRGVGNTALGLSALGFDFGYQAAASFWSFSTSLGSDIAGPPAPPAGNALTNFIGWIGAPGETLGSATWASSGLLVDNIVGSTTIIVPEPATALLFGSALALLGWRRRRR